MFCLPYAAQSFDVVIVSNALHIVPEPEKALAEIHRVLKNDGVLIAPTFTHANNHVRGRVKAFLMKLAGFHQYNKCLPMAIWISCRSMGGRCRKVLC